MSEPRPTAPATRAQLEQGLRLIQIAIAGSIILIAVMTAAFLALTDAPAVPLVPIAAAVVVSDLAFIVIFTRSRREAIRQAELQEVEGSVPSPE